MGRVEVLQQRRADLLKSFEDTLAGVEKAATPEEKKTLREKAKGIKAEFDQAGQDLEDAKSAREMERQVAANKPVDPSQRETTRVIVGQDRAQLDRKRGFRHLGDFGRSVRRACLPGGSFDPRLAALAAMNPRLAAPSNLMQESGGTSGEGFLVPPEFVEDIVDIVFADEGIVARVKPEPTQSNTVMFTADETTPWGSSGVTAAWRAEASQLTAVKPVIEPRVNKLHELYVFVNADAELLEDAPRLNDYLSKRSGVAIAWKLDDAIINGDGIGKPLGMASAKNASLVVVAKDSGQATKTVSATNLGNMRAALWTAGGGEPFWVIHPTALPGLLSLTIGTQPAFVPFSQGMVGAPNGMLLGIPVVWSEHAAGFSSQGDIQLHNPIGYAANVKAEEGGEDMDVKFDVSIHLFFDYNAVAFRWLVRMAGQPILSKPITAANGSQTRSHCVVLAAR